MEHDHAGAGDRLRRLMDAGCVAMPGAFNGLAARAVAKAGFDACYVSGAATSAAAGVPDVGVLSFEHFCRVIREVADGARRDDGTRLPVLADADTGFGEAEMVRRSVIEYERAGAAGLHLEDQEFPKRCGHLDGKRLVSVDHMCEKVEWAARARDGETERRRDEVRGMVLCARTDARGVDGFDAAVARAKAYVEAGADMIFPEGLTSEEEFARFARELRPSVPSSLRPYLLANMTEFGKTPIIPLSKFAAMGYSCVIYPVSLLRVAMGALTRAAEQLKREGSVASFLPQMQTRQELYGLLGYEPGKPWEFPGE
ncbi:MAG: oxaloacetate decarboxylase [Phycisphaerales bacterium]